jgi:hypothetical protein
MTNLKSARIKKLVEVSKKYKIDSGGCGIPFPMKIENALTMKAHDALTFGTARLRDFAFSLLD